MTTTLRNSALAALLIAAAAACSGKSDAPTLTSDLQGDLDAARSSSVQLAPNGSRGTDVVSAEELVAVPGGGTARARQPVRSPSVRPTRQAAQVPTTVPAPESPRVVTAPTPAAPPVNADTLAPIDPRPTPSRPAATPSRRGGYKSVGDVIRDAPFPINP